MSVPTLLLPVGAALVPAGGLLPAGPAGDAPALLRAVAGAAPAVLAAGPQDGVPFADAALRLVLLTALAVVAGSGLVRVLAGAPGRAERVVAGVAALVAVSAAVAAVTRSGAGPTGWTLLLAATVAVPALLATSRPVFSVLPAAVVTALLVLQLAGTPGAGPRFALDAGYAVAGALAAGAAVHLVTTRTDDSARPARVRVLGVAAGAVGAVLAVVRLVVAGPFSLTDLHGTGFGRAALVTVVAPAAVAGLLLAETWLTRRAAGGSRSEAVRADEVRDRLRTPSALAAVTAVGAATLLAALPAPAPAAVPGQALVRAVDLGAGPLTLAVAPMRPGPNLVQLTGAGVSVTGPDATMPAGHAAEGAPAGYAVRAGDRDVPFTARSGAPGGWALVDLPEGTTSITLTAGGLARAVPVDVGTDRTAPAGATGADGPECLSAALGRIVAGGDPELGPCPSETLDPADARALRGTVRALASQQAPGLAIAGDVSPRSRAAADAVRAEAAAAGLPVRSAPGPDDALVVLSGWQHAATTVRDTARTALTTPTALGGTYLAPWLLTGGVLGQSPGTLLPLDFGPQEQVPQRYVRTLAAVAPGSAPSLSGLRAWAATTGDPYTDPSPALYGAAPVSVPMTTDTGDGGHHGAPNEAAWFPGGAVVRIGSALDPGGPAGPTP
ncbi:hypothetical protein [Pseudonocardia sp. ICBG1293]|uniref:hypothetical protein n=1 Tax=Pseudonocardia sp. ICBG1293 TaxID=2844382 RepID=UPI001CCD80A7|nr:hypothetical protein [Pseudonocardia sp. ICBG1293]